MPTPQPRKYLVDDVAKLAKAWAFIKAGHDPIGFDVETFGPEIRWKKKTRPDPARHKVAGFSLSRGQFAIYVPARHKSDLIDVKNIPVDVAVGIWRELFELAGAGRRVWVHNLGYELDIMINEGVWQPHIQPPAGMLCSQVASWLAWTLRGKDVGLKPLMGRILGFKELKTYKAVANGRQADELSPEEIADYAALDAWGTATIGEAAYARLEATELTEHFHTLDMPLVEITRGMARAGMARDRTELERLRTIWVGRRDLAREAFKVLTTAEVEIPTKVKRPTGEFFKNGKPKFKNAVESTKVTLGADVKNDAQVSRWMYDNLKWWPIPEVWDRRKNEYVGIARNDKGVYSVAKPHVQKFVGLAGDPGTAAKLRLEYQKYSKLIGTYLDVLIHLPEQYGDDLIHPSLSITGTMTQRFSGSGPNFQNIPARDITGTEIRRALMAPRPGWVMVVRDYSQIELRLQAEIARDKAWLAGYQMEADFGVPFDVHQLTADLVGAPRGVGKTTNLSVIYGTSCDTLAAKINEDPKTKRHYSRDEAQAFIDGFFEGHQEILKYWAQAEKFAAKNGYIPTRDGYKRFGFKKRWLPREQREGLSPHERRVAYNTPIQGWSGGIMKASCIDLWQRWTAEGIYGKYVLLLNSVHDEIAAGADPDWANKVSDDMDELMPKPRWGIKVATPVTGGKGTTWAEAK